jgi:SpoVK/Ycf46/Vps4 family AAA+-type ATPase
MARADLLIGLIRSGTRGDKVSFRKVAEALAAEEKAKGHNILSKRIADSLVSVNNGNGHKFAASIAQQKNLFYEISPERALQSLFLADNVLEQVRDLIEEQHRSELLHAHNLTARNRILLAGSPGNGKTSLAEAIATELMVPLIVIRYEGLIGSYLGETASRLQQIIDYAKTQRCVFFIDEFETIGKERGDTNETGEIKRIVSSLLLQIDSLPDYVVVAAASNHPELLDRAVWRRFQIRLELSTPTRSQISKFITSISERTKTEFGLSRETMAKRLYGANYAEIEEVCLTIVRKTILTQEFNNPRPITNRVISQWQQRFKT